VSESVARVQDDGGSKESLERRGSEVNISYYQGTYVDVMCVSK